MQPKKWPLAAIPKRDPLGAAFERRYAEHPLTPEVERLVRRFAGDLVTHTVGGESLRGDFESAFRLSACRAADSWRFERGTYIQWIAGAFRHTRNQLVEQLRQRAARWSRTVWIDQPRGDEDAAHVIDLHSVCGVWQQVEPIDLSACRAWLRGLHRTFLDLLVAGCSRNEIRQRCHLPRTRFYTVLWPEFITNLKVFFA